MPRTLMLALMAAMFGGGWYFFKGPGVGTLKQFIQPTGGSYQQTQQYQQNYYPPAGNAPNYSPQPGTANYPTQPTTTYTNQPTAPARPVGQSQYGYQQPAAPQTPPAQGGPTIRIASFNIQVFGTSKLGKPYVMHDLAAIVRNFHIVAIQEIRSKDDFIMERFVREYINPGSDRQYDYVIGPRLGRSNSKEQYAFIYDTTAVDVNRQSIYTVRDPDDLLHREPMVAMFRARGPAPQQAFTFMLVNIHTDPDETDQELDALGQVYQVVRRSAGGEDDIIVLGDLNVDDKHLGLLGRVEGIYPVVRDVMTNTRRSKLYDNIVFHRPSTTEFTGRWGVYDIERVHGRSRDQALQISDHLPIWAEFSAYESANPGRTATGASNTSPY